MRLFVSVDLPADLAPRIQEIQDELRDASGLTFTDPAHAHVTLKFLGDVEESRLEEVTEALVAAVSAVQVGPFEATFAGLGAFPSEEYIRVVWLGVEEGGEELTRLHEAIEDSLVGIGFDPEENAFTPHVTLARMQHAGGKELVQQMLGRHPTVGTMRVDEVRLKESELGSDGPTYSTAAAVPLAT